MSCVDSSLTVPRSIRRLRRASSFARSFLIRAWIISLHAVPTPSLLSAPLPNRRSRYSRSRLYKTRWNLLVSSTVLLVIILSFLPLGLVMLAPPERRILLKGREVIWWMADSYPLRGLPDLQAFKRGVLPLRPVQGLDEVMWVRCIREQAKRLHRSSLKKTECLPPGDVYLHQSPPTGWTNRAFINPLRQAHPWRRCWTG